MILKLPKWYCDPDKHGRILPASRLKFTDSHFVLSNGFHNPIQASVKPIGRADFLINIISFVEIFESDDSADL